MLIICVLEHDCAVSTLNGRLLWEGWNMAKLGCLFLLFGVSTILVTKGTIVVKFVYADITIDTC